MEQAVEQRKNKRFKPLCNAIAFVRSLFPECIVAARILDISSNGLAISHAGCWLPPSTLLDLDIVLPGGEAYLRHLPGTTVSDFEMNGKTIRDITLRRCGIQFQNLTDSEKSRVNSVIQHHTEETEA